MKSEKKRSRKGKIVRIVVFSSLAFLCLGYFVGGYIGSGASFAAMFDKRQSERGDLEKEPLYLCSKVASDYPSLSSPKKLSFKSGENTLKGDFYDVPSQKGLVLVCHGLSGLSKGDVAQLSAFFVEEDFDVATFDFTAHGESEGNSVHGLFQSAYDVGACLDYLEKEESFLDPARPIYLCGYSFGAYGVVAGLSKTDVRVDGVISFSGYDTPIGEMLASAHERVSFLAEATYPPFALALSSRSKGKERESASQSIEAHPNTRFLLFQGDQDRTVPLGASIYSKAKEGANVRKVLLEGVHHEGPWRDRASIAKVDEAKALFSSMKGDIASFRNEMEERNYKELTSSVSSIVREEILSFIS